MPNIKTEPHPARPNNPLRKNVRELVLPGDLKDEPYSNLNASIGFILAAFSAG
jgi:hypothetical protein